MSAVCKSFLYIHAKMILADMGQAAARAYVGSENFSCVSLGDNRECGILVSEPAILQRIESTYNSDWEHPVWRRLRIIPLSQPAQGIAPRVPR